MDGRTLKIDFESDSDSDSNAGRDDDNDVLNVQNQGILENEISKKKTEKIDIRRGLTDDLDEELKDDDKELELIEKLNLNLNNEKIIEIKKDLLNPLDNNVDGVNSKESGKEKEKHDNVEWAHMIDLNEKFENFHELVPEMAIQYPFELDNFQKRAIYHLENNESVFVAAHTSAGKTVVAEYAIAMAQQHSTRCIYTSPIKALSNQKYRDFKDTFEDVGIITGDVQINPNGRCLIMTTEILRSMLYRQSEMIQEIEFVIFDEVHYANDPERGVVWEEVLIMLPPSVTLVLLSATVPNTKEFAGWIGRNKKKDIYVISTPYRPVPLEHYLFFDKKTYKIVDSSSKFSPTNYNLAIEALKEKKNGKPTTNANSNIRGGRGGNVRGGNNRGGNVRGGNNRGGTSRGGYQTSVSRGGSASGKNSFQGLSDRNLYTAFITFLNKGQLLPAIIFSFSKKKCENYADSLANQEYTLSSEKSEIHVFFENSIKNLSDSDKELPQIIRMKEMLSRGIGVHHGGLLPIMKEVVEILFTRGLIKVLFTTETFAMGVNAPAKCVAFTSLNKHDGNQLRNLLPGEYTQMSGRAGRRGLDPTGTVMIICNTEIPDSTTLNKIMLGTPTKLISQFRLTYNMILSIIVTEGLKIEDMMKSSFSENSAQKLVPKLLQNRSNLMKKLKVMTNMDCNMCKDMEEFYTLTNIHIKETQTFMSRIISTNSAKNAFCPGRIVILNDNEKYRNDFAMIIDNGSSSNSSEISRASLLRNNSLLSSINTEESISQDKKQFSVLILSDKTSNKKSLINNLKSKDEKDIADLLTEEISPSLSPLNQFYIPDSGLTSYNIESISSSSIGIVTDIVYNDIDARGVRIKKPNSINDAGLNLENNARNIVTKLENLKNDEINIDFIPEFDFRKEKDFIIQDSFKKHKNSLINLWLCNCTKCPDFNNHFEQYHYMASIKDKLSKINNKVQGLDLALLPEYNRRFNVLKKLGFIDSNTEAVTQKGQIAIGIRTADELILTEIIVDNVFNDYEPEVIVALLSSLVFEEKSSNEPILTDNLKEGYAKMANIVLRVSDIQKEFNLDYINKDTNVALNIGLIEVVYEWANGKSFKEITNITDCLEGTIVRTIVRLGETLQEVLGAAKIIGNEQLHNKIEKAITLIQRDIVFATSLYLE